MKMSAQTALSRRIFMQLAAAATGSTFLTSLQGNRFARADPSKTPTRILFVYAMGSIKELYSPGPVAGSSAPTETSFALGPLHQDLVPYQSDLIVTDGMDFISSNDDPTGANGHQAGGTHALTGVHRYPGNGALGGGQSIDQFIAQKINSPTPVTKYPMWELQMYDNADGEGGPSWLAAGQLNDRIQNAQTALANFPSSVTNPTPQQQAAAAAQLAQRKSVLDLALGEYNSISARLSSADKQKLAQHAQAIRDLESGLTLGTGSECVPPSATLQADAKTVEGPIGKDTASQNAEVLAKSDVMTRLMVSGLSCDLIRVGLLHMPTMYELGPVVGFTNGMFGASDPHDLLHKTADPSTPLWTNSGALDMHKAILTTQSKLLANLLGYMKAVPLADGRTLLDSTVVVLCGQIGAANHNRTNLPWMLAGSANGYFKTGRYLKFDRGTKDVGPPHNNLMVSLANAMGIPITTYGMPSACTGPLAGLV